jgi:protocatechuate 3,4-dioxygenase beta subunit
MKASRAFLVAWIALIALLVGFFVYLGVQGASPTTPGPDPAVVPVPPKRTNPNPEKLPHPRRPRGDQPVIPQRPVTLDGVVHGPQGEPVAGARVAILALAKPGRSVVPGDTAPDMDEIKVLNQLFPVDTQVWDQPRPLAQWSGEAETDRDDAAPLATADTKEDGSFSIPIRSFPGPSFRLTASKEGVGTAAMSSVTPDGRKLDVILGPESSFKGQVLTELDSNPVAGAVVKLDNGARRFSAVTDASGRFAADGVTPGIYRLVVAAKGRTPLFQEAYKVEAADPNPVTLRLPRGTRLVIKCVMEPADGAVVRRGAPSGPAVPNATVYLFSDQILAYVHGTSDAQGAVEFPAMPPGRWSVSGLAKGATPINDPEVTIDRNQVSQEETLEFEASVETPIQVVDEDGRPLSGVDFYTANNDDRYDALRSAKVGTTDSDGRLSFAFAQMGARARLFGFKTGYAVVAAEADFAAGPGETPEPIKIVAKKPIHVHGVVRTTEGKPVPDAVVVINVEPADPQDLLTIDVEIRADADGRYDFPHLPRAEDIEVTASSPDGEGEDMQTIELREGKSDYALDFTLDLETDMPPTPVPVKVEKK